MAIWPSAPGKASTFGNTACARTDAKLCCICWEREAMDGVSIPRARLVGLTIVVLWFFIGGIGHFAATATEMRIVPPYIPWPRAVVLVGGVFELLGAAGLLWGAAPRAGGGGR